MPVFLLLIILLGARLESSTLLEDLEMARYYDTCLDEHLPITFNHLLTTGYFVTPSARMGEAGELSLGIVSAPPYLNWNGRFQLFSHLELSANYRIFRGYKDSMLSPFGFGDYADRGANVKFAFLTPEDSCSYLPGFAIGAEDFMGSCKFTSYYIVGTKVWLNQGLEASLGWGNKRFSGPTYGFFGGTAWFPFLNRENPILSGISLAAEVDPIDYKNPKREPHPDGRESNFPINFGAKYKFHDLLDFSVSCIRGSELAYGGSLTYNWGSTKGFLAKVDDPLPYNAPRDTEPLGCYRPENIMISTLAFSLEEQGFRLSRAWMEECSGEKKLWIAVTNERYRRECEVKMRLQSLLAALSPSDVGTVVVVLESYGLPCQRYVYTNEMLFRYENDLISELEFDLLTCRQEAVAPIPEVSRLLFERRLDAWHGRVSPRFESFLGNAKGKFKYDLGIKAEFDGFLPNDVLYDVQVSYTVVSTIHDVSDFDRYNPSQLPNVLTDYVNYRKRRTFSTDRAYLQKNWNLGHGFFGAVGAGYFQVNYAGLAGELLWYPAPSNFAIGFDGALLKKRRYNGLGFQSKLRKLDGMTPTYRPYSILEQYFLDFYFDFPLYRFFTKLSVGQFLAHDKGLRVEATRYFASGLRLSGWFTYTNAKDHVNGEEYFNRGIALELPLDIFFKCSSRRVWNYGMAAWLRDAGAWVPTGKSLFDIINRERRD